MSSHLPRRRRSPRLSVAAVCLLAAAAIPSVPTLEVVQTETAQTVFQTFSPTGTVIEIRTYHSAEKGFLTDWLRAEKNDLVLTASRFPAQGAGLPTTLAPGERWESTPDAFWIRNRHRTLSRIMLRVGRENPAPLRVGGSSADRTGHRAPPLAPGLYEIRIRNRSPVTQVLF